MKKLLFFVLLFFVLSNTVVAAKRNSQEKTIPLPNATSGLIIKLKNQAAENLNKYGLTVKDKLNDFRLVSYPDPSKIQELMNDPNLIVYPNGLVNITLDESAPMIDAPKVWNMKINGEGTRVCIIDTGIDYTHPAFGSCSPKKITFHGNIETVEVESSHNYADSCTKVWIINKTNENFQQMTIHFSKIATESWFDKIIVADGDGNKVVEYSGTYEDVFTPVIKGSVAYIVLISDGSVNDYGFYIDQLINGTVDVKFDWSDCSTILNGYNFVSDTEDVMDDNGHGTHVAGIVASNDLKYTGIAPGSKLLIAKVMSERGLGYDFDVAEGIQWCVDNGAKVISMSIGGRLLYKTDCDNDFLAQIVNEMNDKGIISSVAAGNEGESGVSSPGCASKALTVAAVDKNGYIPSWSGKGTEVKITAPGVNIKSTIPQGFGSKSGTSMATPHITGVVSLLLQAKPTASVDEIKNAIFKSGKPASGCARYNGVIHTCTEKDQGNGIVNAYDSLTNLINPVKPYAHLTKRSPMSVRNNQILIVTINLKSYETLNDVTIWDSYPADGFEFVNSPDCTNSETTIKCYLGDVSGRKEVKYYLRAIGKGKYILPEAKVEQWIYSDGFNFQFWDKSRSRSVKILKARNS